MSFKSKFACWLALLLLLLAGGCATPKIWREGWLDNRNEPHPDSPLRLYQLAQRKEFVVVYDEYSERRATTNSRAYLLFANQRRIKGGHRPSFISTNLLAQGTPVQVFTLPIPAPESLPRLYAVHDVKKQAFAIYARNELVTTNDLPSYNDGTGTVKRILLTPATLTADATIVGGYLAVIWLESGAPH